MYSKIRSLEYILIGLYILYSSNFEKSLSGNHEVKNMRYSIIKTH